MKEDDYILLKLLLVGETNTGKTTLLTQYTDNQFFQHFLPTIGVDFKIKQIKIQESNYRLQIWDVSGMQRFRQIRQSYYRGAHGIILFYDIFNRQSFVQLESWFAEIDKYSNQNVCRILVANKADIAEQRQVTHEQGKNLAQSLGIQFLQLSSKDADSVNNLFQTLVIQIKSKLRNVQIRNDTVQNAQNSKKGKNSKRQQQKQDELTQRGKNSFWKKHGYRAFVIGAGIIIVGSLVHGIVKDKFWRIASQAK